MRRVLHVRMVSQCAMLEDFGLFLVLADRVRPTSTVVSASGTHFGIEPFRLSHRSSCSEPYESPNVHFSDTTENQRFEGGSILQCWNFAWTDVGHIHEQERGKSYAITRTVLLTENL
jgi:hypothetical protein